MTIRYEAATGSRVAVGRGEAGEYLAIPARRSVYIVLFLTFWLGGWCIGEYNAIQQLLARGFQPFLAFWLGGWTLGGLAALATLVWMISGSEILRASSTEGLAIGQRVLGFERWKHYRADLIADLGPNPRRHAGYGRMPMGVGWWTTAANAALGFAYGGRTVYLGTGLDEAEARDVVNYLRSRLPRRAFPSTERS